jgi:hypothetical protein
MARLNIYSSIIVSQKNEVDSENCDFWSNVNISNGDCSVPKYLYKGQAVYDTDRELFARMQSEYNTQNGVVVEWYVTSYDNQADPVWGEDDNRKFLRKFDVMALFDELPQDQFTFDNFGIFSLDTWKFQVSKKHFECASMTEAAATPELQHQGASEGYTKVEEKQYESHIPQINDYIRIKAGRGNQYYEVVYAEQLDSFLQGSYVWEITIKRMKDEQISVSDEFGQADGMFNGIASVTDNRGEDRLDVTEANNEQLDASKYVATDDNTEPVQDSDAWINSGGDNYDATGGWWDEN